MKTMKDRVIAWWCGETKIFDDPDIIGVYQTNPHWTARAIRWAIKEYKWIVGTVIAVVGLYFMYLALRN